MFSEGQMLAVSRITESMVLMSKLEVKVHPPSIEQVVIVVQGWKRKAGMMRLSESDLAFEGWDLPIGADTDGAQLRGNAGLNLT